jgi:hypothetical protein
LILSYYPWWWWWLYYFSAFGEFSLFSNIHFIRQEHCYLSFASIEVHLFLHFEGIYFIPSLISKKAIWIGSTRRRKECLVTVFETMMFMLTFGRLSWHLSVQRQEYTKKKCRSKFMFAFIGKDLALETGLCRIWISECHKITPELV